MTTLHQNRIIIDPEVMIGKPVIKGTRITVELILRQLAHGTTIEELLENYPHLVRADVYAAIDYASELVTEENVYPLTNTIHGKTKAFA